MKNVMALAAPVLMTSAVLADASGSYGWEDGIATAFAVPNADNIALSNSTENPYEGNHCLSIVEEPLGGTPQIHLAWVRGLSDGDVIDASFFAFDETPSVAPSVRIWGRYTSGEDNSNSAGGNNTYSDGTGWSQLTHSWTFNSNGSVNDGLIIECRMYADNNGNGNSALIDNISVVVTGSDATILFPDSLVGDLDQDGVPDSSDNCPNTPNSGQEDCDGNGVGDACESGSSDCNSNGILDNCDILNGTSEDQNGDGIPDECGNSGLVINEFVYDPDTLDANGDGEENFSEDEYIEILNTTDADIDVSNWSISDGVGVRHTFEIGTTVPANCGVLIFGGGEPSGALGGMQAFAASSTSLGLNNGGDSITLSDGSGISQDQFTYGSESGVFRGFSRSPDGTGDFIYIGGEDGSNATVGLNNSGGFFEGCTSSGDSDGDGVPDDIDNCPNTQNSGQEDCDENGVGDACETGISDCNSNGIPDNCDINDQTSGDCNTNGVPDECDLIDGTLEDNNGNSVPDSCEVEVPADVYINEVRREEPGPDSNDYVEIRGPSGQSMDGISLIIIGDGPNGSGGSGVIEEVIDLSGLVVGSDSALLICAESFTLGPIALADLIPEGGVNLEGSDNITIALVTNFTGSLDQDLDTDDDGTLDATPWLGVVDAVGSVENTDTPPTGTEWSYATSLGGEDIGPDTTFPPAHIWRCADSLAWNIGIFEIDQGEDTPGVGNLDCDGGGPGNCPEDVDGDQVVGFSDILVLLSNWGDSTPDIDGDGIVAFSDLLAVLSAFGDCTP